MSKALVVAGPKTLVFEESPHLALEAGTMRIATLHSGISAGTELSQYRGTSPFMSRQWDTTNRVFRDGTPSWSYPVRNLGYEEVGEIIEIGPDVTGLTVGQRVFGTWGHRTQ